MLDIGTHVGDRDVWFAADRGAAIEVSQTSHGLCTILMTCASRHLVGDIKARILAIVSLVFVASQRTRLYSPELRPSGNTDNLPHLRRCASLRSVCGSSVGHRILTVRLGTIPYLTRHQSHMDDLYVHDTHRLYLASNTMQV